MMDRTTLISTLRERDVRLWIEDDRLKCSAPAGALDDDLRGIVGDLTRARIFTDGPAEVILDGRRQKGLAPRGRHREESTELAIAQALDVPVTYFYENLSAPDVWGPDGAQVA